ncbi:MAG: CPBP family intramembrane glutamic endopeptidase [Promethearchaeota archaeon]
MEEDKLKYYKLARYPVYEVLMEGQIASAGAHQAKLLEKFKKNSKYIKHQYLSLKFVYAFLFTVLPVFPLVIFLQSAEYINLGTHPINTVFFVSSISLMFYFGMTVLYMLMLGMVSTSSFMSGNSFKWLQTLPFSKKSLKKIGLMTIFRNLDIPLIILIAGFPVITLIATQDIFIFLISIPISIVNVLFSFSILVLVGEKMSYLFSESKTKSKRASLVRTITMLGYFIMMFTTGFIFGIGISAVENLFDIFSTTEPPFVLIMTLSLVPFLLAPAFLVSLVNVQFQVHPILILTTFTGFALSIIITWVLFKTAQRALHSAVSTEIKMERVERREVKFEVISTSPIKAYIRKDLVSSTRDIQSFMFVFFPLFYPLIMIFSMIGLYGDLTFSPEVILIIWSILLLFYLIIPIMLVVGFFNIEESGSSTVASLPIIPRDQAKAKVIIMLTIQGLSLVLASVVLTFIINSLIVIMLLLISLPIAWTFLLLMFLMKIKFFGQMKYKYVIEEVNKRNKPLKWIAMLSSEFGFYFVILITGTILLLTFDIIIVLIVLGVIGLLGLTIMVFAFIRMFPRVERMPYYKTGGFLRNYPILGAIILMILYVIFQWVSVFTEILVLILFSGIITINDYVTLLFFDFFFIFGFLTLLWFLVVPRGMKLPEISKSFKDYAKKIRLSTTKPLLRNVILGIGSFVIFSIVVLFGAVTLGNYVFDPSILFGQPNPYRLGLAGLGWFLFIYMLIPGVWEEIAFRGVAIPMLLKKYHVRKSLIISSVIFGFAHAFNLITYSLIGIDPIIALISVSFQVIYATFLGYAFGYIFIKTKSLLPCIILHYLIDSVGQLFFNTLISDIFLRGIFLICFLGLFPAILISLLVKFVVKPEYRMVN